MTQQIHEYFDEQWIDEFAERGLGCDPLGKKVNSFKCKTCGSVQFSITGSAFPLMKHLVKNHNIKFTKAGVLVE